MCYCKIGALVLEDLDSSCQDNIGIQFDGAFQTAGTDDNYSVVRELVISFGSSCKYLVMLLKFECDKHLPSLFQRHLLQKKTMGDKSPDMIYKGHKMSKGT